ncbi:hypothetical protein M0R04_14155 [Candidatus Dojkabacteria bacterium]|jgi:hypothetical protein|nr:hypothetical protein [Candidatus Dojkabacteria bacterium]
MAIITTILSTDVIGNSRATINTNFSNLNIDKAELASPIFTGTVTTPAIVLSSETASTIASFDASKNVKSLALATYPSLTELSYVKGVTSAVQTQLGTKAPSTSPTFATSVTGSYLTASEILITDANKNIVSGAVATYPSLTELSYVKGATSALQTQLNAKSAGLFKNGVTTRDLSTASGDQTIAHGLGVAPKKIRITAFNFNTADNTKFSQSFGTYNGTTNSNIHKGANSNNQYYVGADSTNIITIYAYDITNTSPTVATAAYDATNITLAWTKVGSPTSIAYIMWEAEA